VERNPRLGRPILTVIVALFALALGLPSSVSAVPRSHSVSAVPAGFVFAPSEHRDERLGISVKVPKKWTKIPQATEELWVSAVFLADKDQRYNDKQYGFTWTHRPEMRVVAFPRQRLDDAEDEEERRDSDGNVRLEIVSPYKDYQDYLRRSYGGGGWHITDQESKKVKGVPVTCYEILVERNTGLTGPKHITTWVYHLDIGDVAVQFEVLEGSFKKSKKFIYPALKSFKPIERTQSLRLEAITGLLDTSGSSNLTPAERRQRRRAQEMTVRERVSEGLPSDWTVTEIDGILVLSHVKGKHGKKVVERVLAVHAWLEQTLPFVGPDEYVRMPVIRICKDWEEEMSFRMAGGGWGLTGMEITTHKDNMGSADSYKLEWVNERALAMWFRDRDVSLQISMPTWLKVGLKEMIGEADVKNGKLRLDEASWENRNLRNADRNDQLLTVRELLFLTDKAVPTFQMESGMPTTQSMALTRFLTENRKYEHVLPEYIGHLRAVLDEIDAENEGKADDKDRVPQTEEEEEEMFRNRAKGRGKKAERIMRETFERTFGSWSDAEWKSLEKSYAKTIT
jgi:hypothetical protein